MPSFRWKGRTAEGRTIEGDLTARSKEDVIVRLRQQRIAVSQITEHTSSRETIDFRPPESTPGLDAAAVSTSRARVAAKPKRVRGVLVILGFVLAAFAVGAMGPVTTWTCERTSAGRVDCSVSERDLGLIAMREETLAGVSKVDIETRGVSQGNRGRSSSESRLVLVNADGQSIRSFAWGQSRPADWRRLEESISAVHSEFHAFLADTTQPRISTWGIPAVPLVMIGVLLLFALFLFSLLVLSSFVDPTWVLARAEALRPARRRTP
jgi:hypothetical protein